MPLWTFVPVAAPASPPSTSNTLGLWAFCSLVKFSSFVWKDLKHIMDFVYKLNPRKRELQIKLYFLGGFFNLHSK